jgi:hypothetical protein
VIENSERRTLIMKSKESRKAAIVFVPIPAPGIFEGNEGVNRMRPNLMQAAKTTEKGRKACARRYAL